VLYAPPEIFPASKPSLPTGKSKPRICTLLPEENDVALCKPDTFYKRSVESGLSSLSSFFLERWMSAFRTPQYRFPLRRLPSRWVKSGRRSVCESKQTDFEFNIGGGERYYVKDKFGYFAGG
jgi:hypothetical protein